MLRPGSQNGYPLSFIHIEKTHDYLHQPDSLEITDADVRIFLEEDGSITDTIEFIYTDFDSVLNTKDYRSTEIDTLSEILAGQTFNIFCKRPGYLELTSTTTIPDIPVIVDDNVIVKSEVISFEILRDSLASIYDIFFIIDKKEITGRFVQPETGNTIINLPFNKGNALEGKLRIFNYDLKLSEYVTYNIVIKPQTYQSTYSTVENGYGCFGSLNILEKTITF